MSGTPSRVTRSSSRQPERAPSRSGSTKKSSSSSGSAKKSSSNASNGSAKKKSASSTAAAAESDNDEPVAPLSGRKSSSAASSGSNKKKSASSASSSSSSSSSSNVVERVSSKMESASETVSRGVSRGRSRLESTVVAATGFSFAAPAPGANAAPAPEERKPIVALLPSVGAYAALAGVAHIITLFAFGKTSLQLDMAKSLSCACAGLASVDQIKKVLEYSDVNKIAFFAVVPLYILAGFLLQSGVKAVIGRDNPRASPLAMNLGRILSAALFVATVAGYTQWDQRNSYEGINALFVLRFAYMLQEFLLNFKRFSGPRQLFSVAFLVLTGALSYQAYEFEATVATTAQAPVYFVALNFAFMVVSASDSLAALAGVLYALGCASCCHIVLSLQSIVNYALLPIMSVSLYQKHSMLFPSAAESKQPSFLESSSATAVMVALTFMIILDSFIAGPTRTVAVGGAAIRRNKEE